MHQKGGVHLSVPAKLTHLEELTPQWPILIYTVFGIRYT